MYNLTNKVDTLIRYRNSSSSLIDVMLIKDDNHDVKVDNVDLGFSDHMAQMLYLQKINL
jgi:hypothetical protein